MAAMATTHYFDYAAATPMADSVVAAMQPYLQDIFYNPSGNSLLAKQARQALEAARSDIAGQLGARPSEIIFTAGGTEANNLALYGVVSRYPAGHIVTTTLEHESVLLPARALEAAGHGLTEVKPNEQGMVEIESIIKAITDETVLVSVMYANNEIGTIQPIKQLSTALETIRRARQKAGNTLPLYFHTDAAQAGNYLDLHTHRLGVDLMTVNGGKIYGPKQSGILYVRAGIELAPLILGGGQERGLRSGTENVAACVGLAQALHETLQLRTAETKRLQILQQQCIKQLETIPGISLTGSKKQRLPNNIHIQVEGHDNERLQYALEAQGVICATGSACSASKDEASHVLLSLGMSETAARSSLRFTFGRSTDLRAIEALIAALKMVVQDL